MKRLICLLTVVAFVAAAETTHADVIVWAAGAPGGTSGGSVFFDGANDETNGTGFLDTGLNSDGAGGPAFLAGDYTVSMWLRTPDITRNQYAVGTTSQSLHLGTQNEGLFQGHWGNDLQGSTNAAIANDNWFHATYTYDSAAGTQSVFVNGVETDTTPAGDTTGGPNNLNDIIIGSRRNGSDAREHWTGQVDDVAFFNSVVSDADILALGTSTTDALTLGASAYYDFEDDQFGTTAAVQVAGGATAFGAATLTEITANAVPEPSSLAVLACIGAAGLARRKRR